jgi:hypothetical protein
MTKREYDHFVRGHVKISKSDDTKYKIKFYNISDFLVYQVWVNDKTVNEYRNVLNQKAIDWVNIHFTDNKNISFTPTTVMELGNDKYVFVITNAYLNKKNEVVFCISTKSIDTANSQLTNLPTGKFHNVRFDIDSTTSPSLAVYQYVGTVPGPNGPTTQPTGPPASVSPIGQPTILIQNNQLQISFLYNTPLSNPALQPIYSYSYNQYVQDPNPQFIYPTITNISIIPQVGNAIVFFVSYNSIDQFNNVIYDIIGGLPTLLTNSTTNLINYNISTSDPLNPPLSYIITLINYLNN